MNTVPRGTSCPFAFLLLWLVLFPTPLEGQSAKTAEKTPVRDLEERLEKELAGFRKRLELPGVSVGFVLSDGRQGAAVDGYADLEAMTPLTVKDRLLSGSIGKTYVSAVALQLVGEKKLELDTRISRWFGEDEWFSRLPNGSQITVRMLMNHTSGIPEHVLLPEFGTAAAENPDRVWKPLELLEYILGKEPIFAAGQGWAYADTNYIVLGMILEKVTGRPYYEELERRILQPLNLEDTVPLREPHHTRPRARLRGPEHPPSGNPGKTIREGKFVVNPQLEWTGGGLACTPLDLARWAGIIHQGKAFPKDLMEPFLDGVPAYTGRGDRYGLGVQIWTGRHGTCLGHGGWFPGYVSLMAYYRELKLALAIQINSDQIPNGSNTLREALDTIAQALIPPTKD